MKTITLFDQSFLLGNGGDLQAKTSTVDIVQVSLFLTVLRLVAE